MEREQKIEIVEGYINGLGNRRDFTGVAFAPDVSFENPMTEKLHGVEAIRPTQNQPVDSPIRFVNARNDS